MKSPLARFSSLFWGLGIAGHISRVSSLSKTPRYCLKERMDNNILNFPAPLPTLRLTKGIAPPPSKKRKSDELWTSAIALLAPTTPAISALEALRPRCPSTGAPLSHQKDAWSQRRGNRSQIAVCGGYHNSRLSEIPLAICLRFSFEAW